MLNISPIKIMVIVTVVLLLLGPDKLPEVARKLGSSWQSIKRFQEKIETEVREALPDLPSSSDFVRLARSPVQLLNQLADRSQESDEPARWKPDSNYVDPHEMKEEPEEPAASINTPQAPPPGTGATPPHWPFDPSLN